MFPQIGPILNPLSSATQSELLGVLQREQDRAMALLSSSPLLASLFLSYASQVTALESPAPSAESEEWKSLENAFSKLQEEVDKLKLENLEMEGEVKATAASQEAFRSQISTLKDVNTTQQDRIKTLQVELLEAKNKCDQLLGERNVLENRVLDLEVCLERCTIMGLMC